MASLAHGNTIDAIRARIRDVPNFPKPGVTFKDITPLLLDAALFRRTVELMAAPFQQVGASRAISIESRRFPLGAPLALALEAGLIPTRKVEYALEYGVDALEMHRDAVGSGDRVLIVDDVLATGGTAEGAVRLVRGQGATLVGLTFLIELDFLRGREKLQGERVEALLHYA
jgi:adenine phosphoribosyltransferase